MHDKTWKAKIRRKKFDAHNAAWLRWLKEEEEANKDVCELQKELYRREEEGDFDSDELENWEGYNSDDY